MDQYLDTLQGLIEGRNTFLTRTMNTFRPFERMSVYNQYTLNERMYLETIFRMLGQQSRTTPATQQFVLNIPSNFLDAVPVVATQQQIADAIENVDGTHGECAICQETITSGGSRIRHCRHTYHRSCIDSWLLLSVRCPVCRHDIREQVDRANQRPSGDE